MAWIFARLLKFKRDESGQIALFAVLSMFLFLVCIGYVYNVGMVVSRRVRLQNAADAAAFSGAVVQANALSAIAWLNGCQTYIHSRMQEIMLDIPHAATAAATAQWGRSVMTNFGSTGSLGIDHTTQLGTIPEAGAGSAASRLAALFYEGAADRGAVAASRNVGDGNVLKALLGFHSPTLKYGKMAALPAKNGEEAEPLANGLPPWEELLEAMAGPERREGWLDGMRVKYRKPDLAVRNSADFLEFFNDTLLEEARLWIGGRNEASSEIEADAEEKAGGRRGEEWIRQLSEAAAGIAGALPFLVRNEIMYSLSMNAPLGCAAAIFPDPEDAEKWGFVSTAVDEGEVGEAFFRYDRWNDPTRALLKHERGEDWVNWFPPPIYVNHLTSANESDIFVAEAARLNNPAVWRDNENGVFANRFLHESRRQNLRAGGMAATGSLIPEATPRPVYAVPVNASGERPETPHAGIYFRMGKRESLYWDEYAGRVGGGVYCEGEGSMVRVAVRCWNRFDRHWQVRPPTSRERERLAELGANLDALFRCRVGFAPGSSLAGFTRSGSARYGVGHALFIPCHGDPANDEDAADGHWHVLSLLDEDWAARFLEEKDGSDDPYFYPEALAIDPDESGERFYRLSGIDPDNDLELLFDMYASENPLTGSNAAVAGEVNALLRRMHFDFYACPLCMIVCPLDDCDLHGRKQRHWGGDYGGAVEGASGEPLLNAFIDEQNSGMRVTWRMGEYGRLLHADRVEPRRYATGDQRADAGLNYNQVLRGHDRVPADADFTGVWRIAPLDADLDDGIAGNASSDSNAGNHLPKADWRNKFPLDRFVRERMSPVDAEGEPILELAPTVTITENFMRHGITVMLAETYSPSLGMGRADRPLVAVATAKCGFYERFDDMFQVAVDPGGIAGGRGRLVAGADEPFGTAGDGAVWTLDQVRDRFLNFPNPAPLGESNLYCSDWGAKLVSSRYGVLANRDVAGAPVSPPVPRYANAGDAMRHLMASLGESAFYGMDGRRGDKPFHSYCRMTDAEWSVFVDDLVETMRDYDARFLASEE